MRGGESDCGRAPTQELYGYFLHGIQGHSSGLAEVLLSGRIFSRYSSQKRYFTGLTAHCKFIRKD